MVNRTPKPFKYTLLYNDGSQDIEYELLDDPIGWSEQNISFTRSEDFGLDTEYVIPLSFSGATYTILKSLFESKGAYAIVRLRIDKRTNTWKFNQFYLYRLDFRSYKDNFESIELDGYDDGLLSKIKANSDTEYEIDIPTENKLFLSYKGLKMVKKNLIQCGYGKISDYVIDSDIDHKRFLFKGKRATRTYTENFQFTDASGVPFETMTFKCIKDITFDLVYDFHCKIKQSSILLGGIEDSGNIQIIKHDEDFLNHISLKTVNVNSSESGVFSRIDTFTDSGTVADISLVAGDYVSVFYIVDYNELMTVQIYEGTDCFISIEAEAESQFDESLIEMFTFDWLINSLLQKIDSNSELKYYVTDLGYTPLVGCTQTILNLGKTDGTGKFKAKLKDVLKALNYSYCVSVDITGNVMTIYDRNKTYDSVSKGTLESNNIIIEFDEKHCFGKVKVGGKTKDDYENVSYPFNCIKKFTIPDSLSENEYDLEHPFEIDCYSIEEMFEEVINKSNTDNNDKTDFFVIACKKVSAVSIDTIEGAGYNNRYDYLLFGETYNYQGYLTGVGSPTNPCCIEFSELPTGFSIQTGHLLEYYSATTKELQLKFNYTVHGNDFPQANFELYLVGCDYVKVSESITIGENREYEIIYKLFLTAEETCYIDFKAVIDLILNQDDEIIVDGGWVYISQMDIAVSNPDQYEVYMDHTITSGFNGDSTTAYNFPLTPKRALLKHLPYISVSTYGSSNDIEFTSSERDSNIVSEMDYETGAITENNDVTPVTPIFLPIKLTFDTQKEHDTIYDMYEDKYGYYTIVEQKSNKSLQGWINKAIFAVSKRKTQSWELQAKTT